MRMAFEELMFKHQNEYDLLMHLSEVVKANFSTYHGQNFYIHLGGSENQLSMIDEVKQFTDQYDLGDYLYVERDHEACIVVKSNLDSVGMLLNGRYVFAEHIITENKIELVGTRGGSILPPPGVEVMSSVEMMQAFGMIEDSLQKSKRHVS
jgi:hypothetical protein